MKVNILTDSKLKFYKFTIMQFLIRDDILVLKKEPVALYLATITLCEEIIAGEVNFKISA